MSVPADYDRVNYEWRVLHDGKIGKTPNIRSSTNAWVYNDAIWLAGGATAGFGKTSQVWKFSLQEKKWELAAVKGDSPTARDGHAGSYIGQGKYLVFGGQGFAEVNPKLNKGAAEFSRIKTYNKREIYNDIYQFNCDNLQWNPIYPDGLLFPMGRRGHTLAYFPQGVSDNDFKDEVASIFSSGSHQSNEDSVITSSSRRRKTKKPLISSEIVPNSILLYGGAGIELSKYTEQIYNDLWVYSINQNVWNRVASRGGPDPKPVFDHKMEVINDDVVIIGGICGVVKGVYTNKEMVNNTDVMVYNLKTFMWSYLSLFDDSGNIVRFNLHGFSVARDVSYPENSKQLLIFGGKEIVSKESAVNSLNPQISTVKRNNRYGRASTTFILQVDKNKLSCISCCNPVDRYGHVGISSQSADILLNSRYADNTFVKKPKKKSKKSRDLAAKMQS